MMRALLQRLQKESNGKIGDVRGRGLMWGLEIVDEQGVEDTVRAGAAMVGALRSGVIVLTSGPHCNVVAISPPLVITDEQLQFAIDVVSQAIARA